jgi:hypothetical protein
MSTVIHQPHDKLFKVALSDRRVVDDHIAVRLQHYQMRIIDAHLKQSSKLPVPLIYSMIFYTGQNHWNAPLEIFSFFGEHQNLAREWMLKPYQLLELKNIPDQDIQQRKY